MLRQGVSLRKSRLVRDRRFFRSPRIIDYYHVLEHLGDVARAMYPEDEARRETLRERLNAHLWHGRIKTILKQLRQFSAAAGEAREGDGPEHSRRVLASNAAYFERHREHMDDPTYWARGWPIASAITESGVKQFNKRVKGTEQFWSDEGVESIMALRGLWLSQNDRWNHNPLWSTPPAKSRVNRSCTPARRRHEQRSSDAVSPRLYSGA